MSSSSSSNGSPQSYPLVLCTSARSEVAAAVLDGIALAMCALRTPFTHLIWIITDQPQLSACDDDVTNLDSNLPLLHHPLLTSAGPGSREVVANDSVENFRYKQQGQLKTSVVFLSQSQMVKVNRSEKIVWIKPKPEAADARGSTMGISYTSSTTTQIPVTSASISIVAASRLGCAGGAVRRADASFSYAQLVEHICDVRQLTARRVSLLHPPGAVSGSSALPPTHSRKHGVWRVTDALAGEWLPVEGVQLKDFFAELHSKHQANSMRSAAYTMALQKTVTKPPPREAIVNRRPVAGSRSFVGSESEREGLRPAIPVFHHIPAVNLHAAERHTTPPAGLPLSHVRDPEGGSAAVTSRRPPVKVTGRPVSPGTRRTARGKVKASPGRTMTPTPLHQMEVRRMGVVPRGAPPKATPRQISTRRTSESGASSPAQSSSPYHGDGLRAPSPRVSRLTVPRPVGVASESVLVMPLPRAPPAPRRSSLLFADPARIGGVEGHTASGGQRLRNASPRSVRRPEGFASVGAPRDTKAVGALTPVKSTPSTVATGTSAVHLSSQQSGIEAVPGVITLPHVAAVVLAQRQHRRSATPTITTPRNGGNVTPRQLSTNVSGNGLLFVRRPSENRYSGTRGTGADRSAVESVMRVRDDDQLCCLTAAPQPTARGNRTASDAVNGTPTKCTVMMDVAALERTGDPGSSAGETLSDPLDNGGSGSEQRTSRAPQYGYGEPSITSAPLDPQGVIVPPLWTERPPLSGGKPRRVEQPSPRSRVTVLEEPVAFVSPHHMPQDGNLSTSFSFRNGYLLPFGPCDSSRIVFGDGTGADTSLNLGMTPRGNGDCGATTAVNDEHENDSMALAGFNGDVSGSGMAMKNGTGSSSFFFPPPPASIVINHSSLSVSRTGGLSHQSLSTPPLPPGKPLNRDSSVPGDPLGTRHTNRSPSPSIIPFSERITVRRPSPQSSPSHEKDGEDGVRFCSIKQSTSDSEEPSDDDDNPPPFALQTLPPDPSSAGANGHNYRYRIGARNGGDDDNEDDDDDDDDDDSAEEYTEEETDNEVEILVPMPVNSARLGAATPC